MATVDDADEIDDKQIMLYLDTLINDTTTDITKFKNMFDADPQMSFDTENECDGDSTSHIIQEIDVVFAVHIGIKNVGCWSYLYDNDSFFIQTVVPKLLRAFGNTLQLCKITIGMLIYNPQNDTSVRAKQLIESITTPAYNFPDGFFSEHELFDNQIIKSIVLGYGKYTTLRHTLQCMAFDMAYDAHPECTDDEQIAQFAQQPMRDLLKDKAVISKIDQQYDYCVTVFKCNSYNRPI